ncbi:MAG: M48 family metallopeptidase [Verrucomicrobiales bacterium]
MHDQVHFSFYAKLQVKPFEEQLRIALGGEMWDVELRRNRRSRRLRLSVSPSARIVLSIPLRSSRKQAIEFLNQRRAWLEGIVMDLKTKCLSPHAQLQEGSMLLLGGEATPLLQLTEESIEGETLWALQDVIFAPKPGQDLAQATLESLWAHAWQQLPPRLQELAAGLSLSIRKIRIGNQKGRWGSCSRTGAISLNWRLIQMPDAVADYIMIHELMHLKEMNHSSAFWDQVARACPHYEKAETWLRENSAQLLWLNNE